MKRIFLLLAFMLALSIVSATPTINFQDKEFRKGETILATITTNGVFTKQISNSDITFFDGRKKIFVESEIFFYNQTHYLAIYPSIVGNITMKITNILYKESELKSVDLEEQLDIIEKKIFLNETNNSVDEILSIRPGVFYSASKPKIKLINKGGSNLNVTYNKSTYSISPMETLEVELEPEEILSFFEVSSYKKFNIPIIYFSAGNNTYTAPKEPKLRFEPGIIYDNLILGNSSIQILQLFNFGEENITNITISHNLNFTEIEMVESLYAKQVKNISINITPKFGGHYSGELIFNYTQFNQGWSSKIPVSIFVLPKNNTPEDFFSSANTCEGINGTVCPEECSGKATFTKDGKYCCLGTCVARIDPFAQEDDSGSGWIWGVIILVVLVIAGYYFYSKTKKVNQTNPEEQLKKYEEKYSNRISGSLQKN